MPTPEERRSKPTWPSLLAVLGGCFAAALSSWFALVLFLAVSRPGTGTEDLAERAKTWISEESGTVPGVLVLLLPGQATFLAVSWLFARGSPEGARRRLGLVRARISAPVLLLAVLGTLGVQWSSSLLLDLAFPEPSESMRAMWRMVAQSTGFPAVLVGALISLVPGFCEEVLFRGCGQRGFLLGLPPRTAIALASVLFALAHFDVQYSLAVLPLGLWFGFLAWRTGSIGPSIACHAANNLSAFVFGRLLGDPETGSLPLSTAFVAAGIALCACALLAARALVRGPPAG